VHTHLHMQSCTHTLNTHTKHTIPQERAQLQLRVEELESSASAASAAAAAAAAKRPNAGKPPPSPLRTAGGQKGPAGKEGMADKGGAAGAQKEHAGLDEAEEVPPQQQASRGRKLIWQYLADYQMVVAGAQFCPHTHT